MKTCFHLHCVGNGTRPWGPAQSRAPTDTVLMPTQVRAPREALDILEDKLPVPKQRVVHKRTEA